MIDRSKNNYKVMMIFLALFLLVSWGLFVFLKGFVCNDTAGHYAIVAYSLRGYDAYQLVGKDALIQSVGAIPDGFSTVPWALVFGAIFYAGYMPLKFAKIYIIALHFISLALCAFLVAKKTKNSDKKMIIMLLLASLADFSFMYSLHFGNCGGVVALLTVCAILLVDDKPITAGIIMGIAMMKPQISAIFCLIWLIEKKIKPLITSAVVVIAGWAAASLLTHTGPVMLLKEMLGASTASDNQYLGLISPLRFLGINSTLILAANVVIGAAYTILMYSWLKKRNLIQKSVFIKYMPASIASCFWIYKNGTDYLMLIAAVFALLEIIDMYKTPKQFLLALVCVAYLEMSRCAVCLVAYAYPDNAVFRDAIKSADGFLLLIVGILICYIAQKAYSTEKKIAE
jgi:hypothetical protein